MLDSRRKGFAVMDPELTGRSFEDESLESCKKYCRKGSVIVEQIPYKIGYSIRVIWGKYWKPFYFKYGQNNILRLHWSIGKEFSHKTGKVVYRNDI